MAHAKVDEDVCEDKHMFDIDAVLDSQAGKLVNAFDLIIEEEGATRMVSEERASA